MMHNAVHVEDRYFVTIHDVRTAASIIVIDWHQQRCSRKSRIAGTLAPKRGVHRLSASYRIRSGGSKGAGGRHAPPVGGLKFFFRQYINIITKPMGRGNSKVAVCRRLLLSNRLVFVAFCCLCAVHCMQAAAASFIGPKAVFLACTIGS